MTDPFRRPEAAVAIEAARSALGLARSGKGASDIRFKGRRDLVTAADVAAEDEIRAILSRLPGGAVVGEERGGVAPANGSPFWLVDPICGTANFASGIPLYCVNLALVENGHVTVAVAGDGQTGEVYASEAGHGAWVLRADRWQRLTASGRSSIVVIQDGHSQGARRERAAQCAAAVIRTDRWDLRALGTTLPLVYLAAGRIAGYVEFFAMGLHTAAGCLLAAEAGATVTDIDGQPWTVSSDSVIASATSDLHRELLGSTGPPRGVSPGMRDNR